MNVLKNAVIVYFVIERYFQVNKETDKQNELSKNMRLQDSSEAPFMSSVANSVLNENYI